MKFRLKAFGLHLLASASVLTLVLGAFYLGWYRWPGWYVAGVSSVVAIVIAVDLTLGPLMTFIVARSTKPRRELARDIAIIATMQLCALGYGTVSLWSGRPLFYAFSAGTLELVQSYDFSANALTVARQQHIALRPHWYSLPRWIWVPLPKDPTQSREIVVSALSGGDDITAMPQYFKPWEQGLSELRNQLKRVDDVLYFSKKDKAALRERMRALGMDPDQLNAISLEGRGRPLLVVFDRATLKVAAIIAPPADLRRSAPYRSLVQGYWNKLFPRQKTSHS